jgi:hypothetical protein
MAVSKFSTPTTLTTSSVLIDTAGVTDKRNLVYSLSSSKFVATVQAIPIGIVRMYANGTAPTNYLLCNGQSINTYTYRTLHAVISNKYGGTAYNAGTTDQPAASTTFTLPNLINYAFPYGSSANTSLPTTMNVGGTTFTSSHTHNTTITKTVDAGAYNHSHTAGGNQSVDHTHNFGNATTNSAGHTHILGSNSTAHSHSIALTNASGSGNTGGISANHTHNIGNASASHNHSLNTSVYNANTDNTHTHTSSNNGGTHSTHNYNIAINTTALNHSHTYASATGVFFYIRYQ